MKLNNVEFIKSCSNRSQFPDYDHPEVAFLGRSNVGKSSLINMLAGRKDLVKTGARPGVTRTINFFLSANNISIADLPGFGYAKVPSSLKKTFLPLIKSYIAERNNLKLVFLLIDIRRIPDNFEDEILAALASKKIPAAVTLTKCDKLSRNRLNQNLKKIAETLQTGADSLFITSATKGTGKRELLGLINDYCGIRAGS